MSVTSPLVATSAAASDPLARRWLVLVRDRWLDATLQVLEGTALRPRCLTSAPGGEWAVLAVAAPGMRLRGALALVGAGEEDVRVASWD